MTVPNPLEETRRLKDLQSFKVLDTPPEQAYDDVVMLASTICDAPIALISLVDHQRQWFKARWGLELQQSPREQAFCTHAILQPGAVMQVADAREDWVCLAGVKP